MRPEKAITKGPQFLTNPRRENRPRVYDLERSQSIADETCVLARVVLPGHQYEEDPLAELEGLATTAGCTVSSGLIQRREAMNPATALGKGKTEELKMLVDHCGADLVIFDNDLQPAQTRNLEKALGVKVLDRTELILDIFASNAQTHEARLAVELAQLEYSLPRLKRMWTHLSRVKMGVGMRGPGEKQLEVDRRLVEKRIHDLRTELAQIEQRKERTVRSRANHMTVSLVGYTNAGKSTLMNALTDASVLAQDKLFATLDTRTKRWQLPSWGPVLLSDTVGFIRDLPHRLIASFKATLEEAHQADLLLHVCDGSSPVALDQISAVFGVLEEIEIDTKATLLVVNKVDVMESNASLDAILNRYPHAIPISARTGMGLADLSRAVSDALSRSFLEVEVTASVGNGKAMAFVAAHGDVMEREFDEQQVVMHCRMPAKFLGQLEQDADVSIRRIK